MEEQIQPAVDTPIIETAEKKSSKKVIIIGFIVLLLLIPLVVFGVQFLGNSSKKSEIVVNQKITPTSVPSGPAADTSDNQIDKDVKTVDDGLTGLDSSLNSIDQGLNDQQVNLQ